MSTPFLSGGLGYVNKNLLAGSILISLEFRTVVNGEDDYPFTSYGANVAMKAFDISPANTADNRD